MSLTPVADELLSETPDLPETLEISVAAGAELALDFPGTLKIDKLQIAGRSYVGTIDASVVPGVVIGQGAIEVTPKGTMVIFR